MSSELSSQQKRSLLVLLKEINKQCDLSTVAIVASSGTEIAFFAEAKVNRTLMSALASAIASTGAMSMRQIEFGELEEVIIKGVGGYLVVTSAAGYLIIGASTETHSLGLTKEVLKEYAKKIGELLSVQE